MRPGIPQTILVILKTFLYTRYIHVHTREREREREIILYYIRRDRQTDRQTVRVYGGVVGLVGTRGESHIVMMLVTNRSILHIQPI